MLSHFSTLSPALYRIGVSSLISRSDRAFGGALWREEDFLLLDDDDAAFSAASVLLLFCEISVAAEGRELSRNCWISLIERDRPVPS